MTKGRPTSIRDVIESILDRERIRISELDRRLGGTGAVYTWLNERPTGKPSRPGKKYIDKLAAMYDGLSARELKDIIDTPEYGSNPILDGPGQMGHQEARVVVAMKDLTPAAKKQIVACVEALAATLPRNRE